MRIIVATNRAAIERLLARRRGGDRAFDRQVRTIVERVRLDGDRALLALRADVRRRSAAARGERRRDARAGGASAGRRPARDPSGGPQHRARRVPSDSETLGSRGRAGRVDRTARRAHRARRLLRARRTLSAALVAADDGRAGARRRRPRDRRRLPAAGAGRDGGRTRGRRDQAVPRGRRPRHRRARLRNGRPFRASTRSSGPATSTSPPPSRWSPATARSTSTPGRPKSSSWPVPDGRPGWRRTSSRRASTTRTPERSSSPGAGRLPNAWPASSPRGLPVVRSSNDRSRPTAPSSSPAPPTRRWRWPIASRPNISSSSAKSLTRRPLTAGAVFVGPYTAQAAGDYATGSNHVLPTSGAARFRGGLSAADFVRVMSVQRVTKPGLTRLAPDDRGARARRGPRGARRIDRGAPQMTTVTTFSAERAEHAEIEFLCGFCGFCVDRVDS